MIHMVLIFCLMRSPTMCVRQTPMFTRPMSMMACMVIAQQTAGVFVHDHPGYRLARWICTNRPQGQSG